MDKVSKTLKCLIHTDKPLLYLYPDSSQKNVLKCSTCIIHDSVINQNLIQLEDINECDKKTFLNNWPFEDSQKKIFKQIKIIFDKTPTNIKHKEDINYFFKELRVKLNYEIENLQNESEKKADSFWNLHEIIMSQYNEMSRLNEMKSVLSNLSQEKNMNEQLKDIITQVKQMNQESEKQILQSLDHLTQQESMIDFKTPKLIGEKIQTILESIDFFAFQDVAIKQGVQQTSQLIMKLVGNKFNRCPTEFLQKLEKDIQNSSLVLNQSDIENIQKEQLTLPDYTKLTEDQFKEMLSITSSMISNNYMNQNSGFNSHKRLNYDDIIKLVDNENNCCDPSFVNQLQGILKGMSQYIKSFIISDILDSSKLVKQQQLQSQIKIYQESITNKMIEDFENLTKREGIHKFNLPFIKSDWQESEQIQIEQNANEQFKIIFPSKKYSSVISSRCFDSDQSYIIRIQFHFPTGNYYSVRELSIGLIQESQINSQLAYSDKFSGYSFTNCKDLKVIKGSNYVNIKKNIDILECRIHIDSSQLYFADYPHYQNINVIDLESPYKVQYRFAICCKQSGFEFLDPAEVTVTEVFEINNQIKQ